MSLKEWQQLMIWKESEYHGTSLKGISGFLFKYCSENIVTVVLQWGVVQFSLIQQIFLVRTGGSGDKNG